MRTCCSGGMSRAVTNRSFRSWGTPAISCSRALPGQLRLQLRGVDAARCGCRRSKRGETSRRRAPSSTRRTKARAKSGSMPLLVPAMMLMVPVGATVVTVAFLMALHFLSWDCSKSGKEPRSSPSCADSSRAVSVMNFITSSAMRTASLGVVGDIHLNEHLGKAHHPQADLARSALSPLRSASGESGSHR